jgi:hypothetical protein
MTHRTRKPKHSDESATVVIGDKSWESLVAEFGDLRPVTTRRPPPPGAATADQLQKIWNRSGSYSRKMVRDLLSAGKLKFVGKFHTEAGLRNSYPVAHYMRVK